MSPSTNSRYSAIVLFFPELFRRKKQNKKIKTWNKAVFQKKLRPAGLEFYEITRFDSGWVGRQT